MYFYLYLSVILLYKNLCNSSVLLDHVVSPDLFHETDDEGGNSPQCSGSQSEKLQLNQHNNCINFMHVFWKYISLSWSILTNARIQN